MWPSRSMELLAARVTLRWKVLEIIRSLLAVRSVILTGLTSITGRQDGAGQTVVSLEKTGTATAISGNILLGLSTTGSNTGTSQVQEILVLNNSLSGTTVVANENEIADSSVITFQGGNGSDAGVLRMLSQSETIGGIQSSTSGDGIIQNNGNLAGNISTLTLNTSGTTNYTYSGLIQDHDSSNSNVGTLAITKKGSGTQNFTNANTYTGGTTISGNGALYANNFVGSATGTGSLTLSTGATLGGTGSINSTNNLIQGNVAVGQAMANDTNVTNTFTMTATGTTTFSNANPSVQPELDIDRWH